MATDTTARAWKAGGAIFLTTVVVRLAFHLITGYTFDDAYITYRYAENLAAGLGFVYNPGEIVLGTTTPLFTLLLAALRSLGIAIPAAALGISLIAAGLTAVVVYRYAERLGFGRLTVVPVVLFMLFPRLLPTDTGGMETALFALLVTAAFYFRLKGRQIWSVAAASLAVLTRPEGLLVLALLLVDLVINDRRKLWAAVGLAAVVIVPWIAFATVYFGSPLPHSMVAKIALYSQLWARPLGEKFIFVMGWHSPLGWVLAAAAILGVWQLARRSGPRPWLEAIWILLTVVALTFSSTMIFRWYMAPIYPVYILLACAALLGLRGRWSALPPAVRASVIGVVVLALLAVNHRTVNHYRLEWQELRGIHQGIVDYLAEHAEPGDVLCTEDIGYVGYYGRMTILDRAGLVSPISALFNRAGDFYGLIAATRPDWLVVSASDPTAGFLGSAAFTQSYEQVRTFEPPQATSWTFNLYRKRP